MHTTCSLKEQLRRPANPPDPMSNGQLLLSLQRFWLNFSPEKDLNRMISSVKRYLQLYWYDLEFTSRMFMLCGMYCHGSVCIGLDCIFVGIGIYCMYWYLFACIGMYSK